MQEPLFCGGWINLRLHQDATTKVSCNARVLHEWTGMIHMRNYETLYSVWDWGLRGCKN